MQARLIRFGKTCTGPVDGGLLLINLSFFLSNFGLFRQTEMNEGDRSVPRMCDESLILLQVMYACTVATYAEDIRSPMRFAGRTSFAIKLCVHLIWTMGWIYLFVYLSATLGSLVPWPCGNSAAVTLGLVAASLNVGWSVVLNVWALCHSCKQINIRAAAAAEAGAAADADVDVDVDVDFGGAVAPDPDTIAAMQASLELESSGKTNNSSITADDVLDSLQTVPTPDSVTIDLPGTILAHTSTASIASTASRSAAVAVTLEIESSNTRPGCAICCEPLWHNSRLVVKEIKACGHRFHAKCLLPWLLERKNTCPLCRCTAVIITPKSKSAPQIQIQ
jgi:hypothetical protein